MARKKDVVKVIDQKSKSVGAPLPLLQEDQPAPPGFYLIPAPDTLVEVAQAIQRSTQAALVMVSLGWQEAPNIAPDYYNVEWDESSSFTNLQRVRASTTSATIDGLKANGVTYYFRVQAVLGGIYSAFSDTLTVVTMTDTTPAPDVSSLAATFNNGDLLITWVKPSSEMFKDAEIRIYNSGHSILYATLYSANQQIIWTAEQNLAASSNVGITSVYIDVRSRSWSNTFSTGVNTTATSSIPTTPSPTFNWTGDTGVVTADLGISWSRSSDTDSYDLILDGLSLQTKDVGYTYRYAQNVKDHVPTLASGDPNITYVLRARNKLNQQSSPASGTISNAAPPSGIMSMTVSAGFSTLGITIALLGGIVVNDFDHYEYALASGSTIFQRYNSPDNQTIMQVAAAGSYVPTVTMVDKFNQRSATLSGAIQVIDALTITDLRAETVYTDSFNTNFTPTVSAVLKNNVLYTGTLSDAIRYATASGVWNWIKASRPLIDRYKANTVAMAWPTTSRIYFEYNDGINAAVYYAGPITTTGVGDKVLTSYTSQTTARSNAISLGAAGNTGASSSFRYDTPVIQEARNITLWFQTDGGNFDLYEYYPRRLVQSDDIEAESIRSINVAALGINADRIFAVSLSAFTASMGTLHIDSLLDISTNGIIFQGSGSGTTLQNATTPTSFNVTGLKIYNSGGVGKLSTYNAGVEQITLDTDGKFKAGAGQVLVDANGVTLLGRTVAEYTGTTTSTNAVQWKIGSEIIGSIETYYDAGSTAILSIGANSASYLGKVALYAKTRVGMYIGTGSVHQIAVDGSTATATIASSTIQFLNASTVVAKMNGGFFYPGNQTSYYLREHPSDTGLYTNDKLSVIGNLSVNSSGGFGIGAQTNVRLYVRGQDSTNSNYAIYADDSGGTMIFYARNDGAVVIRSDLYSNGTKVLGQRITGWGAPTGTTTKTTFATTTITTQQLAERVKGLIEDLKTHGLLGA